MATTRLQAIPANIITGFLGVGKTTALLWLLEHKPIDESWAILVNEFGEIGIDGSLLNAASASAQGVYVRELPGGCMCCTAGVPFRVALNQLIKQSRPQRLLIEPTGLGHPQEVIGMLTSAPYAEIIDLQATITLVDARKIVDPRYRGHDIFRQQLQVADWIVANKQDQYRGNEERQLAAFLHDLQLQHLPVSIVEQGRLQYDWLQTPRRERNDTFHVHQSAATLIDQFKPLPDCGYRRVDNQDGGFYSCGWLFEARFVFDFMRIYNLLRGIEAERLKAIIRTEQGWMLFNKVDDMLSYSLLHEAEDTRLELIDRKADAWQSFDKGLLNAILPL